MFQCCSSSTLFVKVKFNSGVQLKPERISHCSNAIQHDISIFSDPGSPRAFLPLSFLSGVTRSDINLVPFQTQTYICFSVFVSWPSPWLLHFPRPARRSLGCLWNGSSAGLLWDVTEKGRSAAPSPLCSCRVPSGSVNSGLALVVLNSLCVCVFVWERKRERVYTFRRVGFSAFLNWM